MTLAINVCAESKIQIDQIAYVRNDSLWWQIPMKSILWNSNWIRIARVMFKLHYQTARSVIDLHRKMEEWREKTLSAKEENSVNFTWPWVRVRNWTNMNEWWYNCVRKMRHVTFSAWMEIIRSKAKQSKMTSCEWKKVYSLSHFMIQLKMLTTEKIRPILIGNFSRWCENDEIAELNSNNNSNNHKAST